MAITRRWQAGGESQLTNSHNVEFSRQTGANMTANAMTGSYAFYCDARYDRYEQDFDSTYQFRVAGHFYIDNSSTGSDANQWLLLFKGSGAERSHRRGQVCTPERISFQLTLGYLECSRQADKSQ